MPAAGLELHGLAGFDEQASVDRAHGHDALVERHFVNLDFFRRGREGEQQPITQRSLVLDGEISSRNFRAAWGGAAPGLRDDEIANRDFSGMSGGCEQPPAGKAASQSDYCISHDTSPGA